MLQKYTKTPTLFLKNTEKASKIQYFFKKTLILFYHKITVVFLHYRNKHK